MSEQVIGWIIQGIVAIILAWIGRRGLNKLTEIAKTSDAVHTLVNSNMGRELKISAVALRRINSMTHVPEDERIAKLAETALTDHETKQAVVDSGGTRPYLSPELRQ